MNFQVRNKINYIIILKIFLLIIYLFYIKFDYLGGVPCFDGLTRENFLLKAHIISWSGDIPALSKTLNLSGHNAIKGCRFCHIEGISTKHVYYPLPTPPTNNRIDLPQLRTHNETYQKALLIESINNETNKKKEIKKSGTLI